MLMMFALGFLSEVGSGRYDIITVTSLDNQFLSIYPETGSAFHVYVHSEIGPHVCSTLVKAALITV